MQINQQEEKNMETVVITVHAFRVAIVSSLDETYLGTESLIKGAKIKRLATVYVIVIVVLSPFQSTLTTYVNVSSFHGKRDKDFALSSFTG